MHVETTTELSPGLLAFIQQWKDKPGNLIMVLHRVQQTFGYVPREAAFEVADLLSVPLAKIYGVITFYNFFKLKRPGRNRRTRPIRSMSATKLTASVTDANSSGRIVRKRKTGRSASLRTT